MEQMFRQFLDQFQNSQSDRNNCSLPDTGAAQVRDESVNPSTATEKAKDATVLQTVISQQEPTASQVNPHVSRIQQLLDAAEADAARFEVVGHESDFQDLGEGTQEEHVFRESHICHPDESREPDRDDGRGRRYADGFGELDVDSHGQLRYVGLGSTASVAVENCIGLRRYITRGLEERGYETEETFFTSPEATRLEDTPEDVPREKDQIQLPPPELVDVLITIYVKDLAYLFPITTERDIRQAHRKLLLPGAWDHGHAAAFYAILAVAAPLVKAGNPIFDRIGKKWVSAGPVFYNHAMHFVNLPFNGRNQRKERSQDIVTALGLLGMYLAETGSQAEAWISVGRAIRIAQDIGLHRSPERLRLPREEWERRRYVWWCLYILERQLCTGESHKMHRIMSLISADDFKALGRPLSINDEDCDTEIPAFMDETGENGYAGFTSLIHLHRVIGTILKIVSSVRNADSWRSAADDGQKDELQARVQVANDSLQAWAKDMVPPHIKTAKSGTLLAEKHVALSCFFSAVMLLHRVFIRNPHRPSPLAGSQAQLKSAKAATDCIRGTAEFSQCVPMSHFTVFHGQYVFVSALILLSCIRWSDEPKFVYQALRDVEEAMLVLQRLEEFWMGARKCRGTVEEYLEFTFKVLQGDRNCHFDCEYGHQPHDTTNCKTAKRKPIEATNEAARKKARLSDEWGQGRSSRHDHPVPVQPSPKKHKSKPAVSLDLEVTHECPPSPSPVSHVQTIHEDTHFFDNTITNFLGAIDTSVDFNEQIDLSLDMQLNVPGVFFSPDHESGFLQNSFF